MKKRFKAKAGRTEFDCIIKGTEEEIKEVEKELKGAKN